MAKNILQGIRGTASSHPVAHIGQSGLETKTSGETESELLTYLLQLAAVVLGCLSAATHLLLLNTSFWTQKEVENGLYYSDYEKLVF